MKKWMLTQIQKPPWICKYMWEYNFYSMLFAIQFTCFVYSVALAEGKKKEGNQEYVKKNYEGALRLYTEAISKYYMHLSLSTKHIARPRQRKLFSEN